MSTRSELQSGPETNKAVFSWPESPYKALSFYVEADAPLFAGRDKDVFECANLLGLTSTRILILHGNTGCGKSSFLRAGLIPFLERQGTGFQFLKADKDNTVKPIFVRSTDCPLLALAEEIYKFAEHDTQRETPLGPKVLLLSEVIADYKDRNVFVETVGTSAKLMINVLNDLANILPKTLILIIDQAEEVLTLKPGVIGEKDRTEFFDFMAQFTKSQYDLKLLVALRTEYFGFFYDAIREKAMDTSRIRDFVLKNFTREQVEEAITRPTSIEVFPIYGRPYDNYRFTYSPKLPERIARDLEALVNSGNISGGVLPVMQVVCERLYQRTKPKDKDVLSWEITDQDYKNLGSVEEQIGEYLRGTLVNLCRKRGMHESEIVNETARWRDVLSELARSQADGTVTSEVLREEDLQAVAIRVKCKLPFKDTVTFLADDNTRILRSLEKVDLTTNRHIQCYSLAHDAIGLFLRRWKVTQQERKAAATRGKRNVFVVAIITILIGIVAFFFSIWAGGAFIFYGLLFIVSGLMTRVDTYPTVSRSALALSVRLFPKAVKHQFVKDSLYRERLRQYPELSDRFESSLTRAD